MTSKIEYTHREDGGRIDGTLGSPTSPRATAAAEREAAKRWQELNAIFGCYAVRAAFTDGATWQRESALSGGERAEVLRVLDLLIEEGDGWHETNIRAARDLAARLRSTPSEAEPPRAQTEQQEWFTTPHGSYPAAPSPAPEQPRTCLHNVSLDETCHICAESYGNGRATYLDTPKPTHRWNPEAKTTEPIHAPEQRAETPLPELPISRTTLQRIRNADVGYWLHDYEVCPNEVVDQALAAHDLRDALSLLKERKP